MEPEGTAWPARAVYPGLELERSGVTGVKMGGHFVVFNQWTRIDSIFEGTFMERIARGSRSLFQHGFDPYIGDKPLGRITELAEDERGARYSVDLLDTAYTRELLPALDAGLFGASFRFRPLKADIIDKPKPSSLNLEGLREGHDHRGRRERARASHLPGLCQCNRRPADRGDHR